VGGGPRGCGGGPRAAGGGVGRPWCPPPPPLPPPPRSSLTGDSALVFIFSKLHYTHLGRHKSCRTVRGCADTATNEVRDLRRVK
jgi:hypothetical protein